MARTYPSVDDTRVLGPERFGREPYGWRYRRNPVEPVEHREPSKTRTAAVKRDRQVEQREAAERVIREEQAARRVPVGQPARGCRPDDIEDPHHREQLRRSDLRNPVIVTRGDEMRADEAVRARTADEERPGQDPERPRA